MPEQMNGEVGALVKLDQTAQRMILALWQITQTMGGNITIVCDKPISGQLVASQDGDKVTIRIVDGA
jgi:hypothetical protein